MGRYLVRRILFLILVLWIVSILTFLIFMKMPPGNPARRAVGRTTTPAAVEQAAHRLGLDKPIWVQYGRFAKGLIPWPGWFLNQEFYYSWTTYQPVSEIIYSRLPVDFALAIGSAIIWLAIGIPIGVISAVRPRSLADRTTMVFALAGVSAPVFWLGYLLLYFFWYKLHWAPPSGIPAGMGVLQAVFTGVFVLPWIAIAVGFAAFYARMTRANLRETLSEDYIRTARSKGLSERKVVYKHGLRAAITPVVTMFGMDLGILVGGAVITETVFNLPGVGQYVLIALSTNDFPTVMGITMFAAFFIVVANLVVDVVYAFLDPRVRYS